MKSYFLRLARYNHWANRRLYDAVAQLDETALHAPRSGFFPSVAKTLNHLVVTDRMWLGRFLDCPSRHRRLDEMPYARFADLKAAREVEDRRILDFAAGLEPDRIQSVFHYRSAAGEERSGPMAAILGHFFNHQTHHRGQAHAMLASTSVAPPPLDLSYFINEEQR